MKTIYYIIIGIVLITGTLFCVDYLGDRRYEQGYDSGYFYGWLNSQFKDCSKPDSNKTMTILSYKEGIGMVEHSFTWEEGCKRLTNNININDITGGLSE